MRWRRRQQEVITCPEFGHAVDPSKAKWIHGIPDAQVHIMHPSDVIGAYCCTDHLLDAYERGWALTRRPS